MKHLTLLHMQQSTYTEPFQINIHTKTTNKEKKHAKNIKTAAKEFSPLLLSHSLKLIKLSKSLNTFLLIFCLFFFLSEDLFQF